MPMPSVFISHGSPTLALEHGRSTQGWQTLAASLPRPRAIVVQSAHWPSRGLHVGAHPQPPTVHDFGGFPAPLYQLDYPAPGAPELAARVEALLHGAGLASQRDAQRGLDHGAWVPLKWMYPKADIPVVPISLPWPDSPAQVLAIGRALAPLQNDGVLLLGSGGLTHNLRAVRWDQPQAPATPDPAVPPFQDWISQRLRAHDLPALLAAAQQAPSLSAVHPSDDHWLPFFFALGASWPADAPGPQLTQFNAHIEHAALAMDSWVFTPDASTATIA